MTLNPDNNQQNMIPASVLEKIVTKLLIHDDRESLRTSFIELINELYQPRSIQLFTSGLRGIVTHRGQAMAEVFVRDVLNHDTDELLLSQDESLLLAVETVEIQLMIADSTSVHLYVPLMQGDVIGSVLILRNVSFQIVDDFVWQHVLMAYNNLNRMLYSAEIDPLTGLMNRLAFDRLLQYQAADEAERIASEKSTYFALADIDFFKKVNDNFGHLYGDEVLILLARAMSESFRSMDWLFRYGGEEFGIVLVDVSEEDAFRVLERFRHKIETMIFPQVGQITISLGFSKMGKLEPVSSLIDRADNALYYAKHNGRNKVFSYEDLHEQGLLSESATEINPVELF
ncbi:MAG: GGDEF domain-containing protein [Methylophagaceae bacterium]